MHERQIVNSDDNILVGIEGQEPKTDRNGTG